MLTIFRVSRRPDLIDILTSIAACVIFTALTPQTIAAQGTTGTLRGRVTDAETGEPLNDVNIELHDITDHPTGLGSSTNDQGEYVILNIPPGNYCLRVSMIGFKPVEVRKLVIRTGVSTVRDFQLQPTILDLGYVLTVTAEDDPIKRDVTSTRDSYTSDEMERMSVYSTSDILNLQTNVTSYGEFQDDIPGYRDRGLEMVYVRGGRNAEVAFMIDGMQVTNLVFGGQAARVSPVGLVEMVVMASGMSAEFGNALSGVVNFVTRNGGSSYDGSVEVLSSELSAHQQDDVRDMTRGRFYFGGPVPITSKLFFYLSGSASTQRDYLVKKDEIVNDLQVTGDSSTWDNPDIQYEPTDPYLQTGSDGRKIHSLDIYSGWLGYGFDVRWDGLMNLTYKISPTMRLKFSRIHNRRLGVPYTFQWRFSMFWGLPGEMEMNSVLGTPRYDASEPGEKIAGTGMSRFANEKNVLNENHRRLAWIWTHQPSVSTFYSLRASHLVYNRTMRVRRWVNNDGYVRNYYHMYQKDASPLWEPGDQMTQVTLKPIGYEAWDETARRFGYMCWHSAGLGYTGSDRYYSDHIDITRTVKADVTTRAGMHHQVKAGFVYNRLMLDQNDLQVLWYYPPYQTTYVHKPWEMGIYVQDKIEYPHLVLNLGVRYDASHAGEMPWWRDPRNPTSGALTPICQLGDPVESFWTCYPDIISEPFNPEGNPFRVGKIRHQFSPRIGISHPVTDRAVFYFNYGHFFQNPVYRNLYLVGTLMDGVPLIGNPTLENEHSVHYEFGMRNYLDDIHVLGLTVWAKDTSNLVGSELIPSFYGGIFNPYSYTVFINYDYALARGFDISLHRCFSGIFSGRLNYSFLYTQSNRDDPWTGYREDHTMLTGPKRPRAVGWDQPHRFTGQVDVHLTDGFGPDLAGFHPLENISANFIFRASAGRPFTPTTRKGKLETHSGRRPWTCQCDMRISRDFEIFGLECGLIVQVRNVFNRRNVVAVYGRTGKPDEPGPGTISYSDNYDRSHYYGQPRLIDVGLRLLF